MLNELKNKVVFERQLPNICAPWLQTNPPCRLPFEARSLNELKNKIILGSFAPLRPGQPYSAGLVAVCHALLNKDPRRRPTCAAILNSSEAAPWLHAIPDAVRCPLPPLDAVPSELLLLVIQQLVSVSVHLLLLA